MLASETRTIYTNAFETKCFKLMQNAYHISVDNKLVELDWEENDISQVLCENIDNNPDRKKWRIHVSREYHLSNNASKNKGFADKLSRIDFKMSTFWGQYEFQYFFEAKRLKEKDSSLKRLYIDNGMDRFIKNKYPLGCMLGFLLEGSISHTIIGINKLLTKDCRHSEILSHKNQNTSNYYESSHTNIGLLKHIILDFTLIK